MIVQNTYKVIELIVLFFIIPIVISIPYFIIIKILLVLLAVLYCLWLSRKLHLFSKKELYEIKGKRYLKSITLYFLIIIVSTSFFVWKWMPENLFIVVKKAPLFWIGLILFYSIFSVYPQELLYRLFFFKRYGSLLSNRKLLIALNVAVFPLAHLFFHNWIVLVITLIGGTLFSISYNKTNSLMLTSIEHALYGSWLFTVGMGKMLGFPIP